jgi:hypothetical protein
LVTTFCALLAVAPILSQPVAAPKPDAKPRKTTILGSIYAVDPHFDKSIAERIALARQHLREQRKAGKFTAYLSVPISPRGGSWQPTNVEITGFTKQRLEAKHGGTVWFLNPCEYQLFKVDGREPEGGEFLYMWTEILAGEDGRGSGFDMVYFLGPSDVSMFFAKYQRAGELLNDSIHRYVDLQTDAAFRREIAGNPERLLAFRRFYQLRASVAWSKGAHDEWNIFVRINKKRGVGEQIPIYFDGRAVSPAEMETEIAPGYELK